MATRIKTIIMIKIKTIKNEIFCFVRAKVYNKHIKKIKPPFDEGKKKKIVKQ